MRAVLDADVIVAALLSPTGTPARLVETWLTGGFELVVSPRLIDEVTRVLAYPKLRQRIDAGEATRMARLLCDAAAVRPDPPDPPPIRSPDPDDDCLLALAAAEDAALVSGDSHLRTLADAAPIFTPAAFLARLDAAGRP